MSKRSKVAKVPRMEFRYSWAYDQEHRLRFTDPMYPSGDVIRDCIEEVSGPWKPRRARLLRTMSALSGLHWREDLIVCYVVGRGMPLSDPLTMPVYEGQPGMFMERMAYQLVERLMMHPRNLKARSAFWESMFRDLSEDGVKVSYMVPVNAAFREVLSRHFPDSPRRDMSLISTNLDYKRAWEVVDGLGHREVLERFRRGAWE